METDGVHGEQERPQRLDGDLAMANKNALPRPGYKQNPMKETRANKSSPIRTRPKVMTNSSKGQ